jgi:hypothetical protein
MKQVFILAHDVARQGASRAVMDAPAGHWVTISEPRKKREQEEKYHAMLADLSRQTIYAGRKWDADDMKRLMVDEFAEEMRLAGTPLHHDGRLVPSENGRRVIQLGVQTSAFYVKEAAQFIEFLYAQGAEREVRWSEPRERQAA